jgi:Tfp pilus assembly protein PilF
LTISLFSATIVPKPDLGRFAVKKVTWLILAVVWLGGCASGRRVSEFSFGNQMAREGLWKEAIYRWERALAVESGRAALHNNLAVAYEHEGRPAEAEVHYREALRLAPADSLIQANYSRFKKVQEGKSHGQ